MPFTKRGNKPIGPVGKQYSQEGQDPPLAEVVQADDPTLNDDTNLRDQLARNAVSQHRIQLRSDGLNCLTLWSSNLLSDISPASDSQADVSWETEVPVETQEDATLQHPLDNADNTMGESKFSILL